MDASLINADKPPPPSVLSTLVGVGWAMCLQVLVSVGSSLVAFVLLALCRYVHHKRKTRYRAKWMGRIVPREYVPGTGSVFEIKKYQYSYPSEIEVIPPPGELVKTDTGPAE